MYSAVLLFILNPRHAVRDLIPLPHPCGIHPGWHGDQKRKPLWHIQQVRQQQGGKPASACQPVFRIYPDHPAAQAGIKLYLLCNPGGKALARQTPEYLVDTHVQYPDIAPLILPERPVDLIHLEFGLPLQTVVYEQVCVEV